MRRGLLGEVYFRLWNITGIKPGSFVFITQVMCYFIFYLFTGLLLRRQNNLLAYIVLIISPFIFTYHLHDIQGGFRKEILYLALFSSYVWLMLTTKPGTQKIASILVLLIYPVLVLSHEMLAVFLPYFLMLYFYKSEYFEKKDLFYVSIYVGLSVFAFFLALIYTGSEQHVSEICNSLKEHAAVNCESLGAIAALSESTGYGRDIVQSNIARNDYIWKYLICSLLALIAYIPIANRFFHHFIQCGCQNAIPEHCHRDDTVIFCCCRLGAVYLHSFGIANDCFNGQSVSCRCYRGYYCWN